MGHYRDYAASGSLLENVVGDIHLKKQDYGDLMYSLYLDNGAEVSGRRQRFACGILVDKSGLDKKEALLDMNEEIRALQEANTDDDPPALQLWKQTSYESISLPSVDAAVLQFPCTNGIVSSLVLSYKVSKKSLFECVLVESRLIHSSFLLHCRSFRPYVSMRQKRARRGTFLLSFQHAAPWKKCVRIMRCVMMWGFESHYLPYVVLTLLAFIARLLLQPLVEGKQFLLGQPDSEFYLNSLPDEKMFDLRATWKGFKKIFPPFRWLGYS